MSMFRKKVFIVKMAKTECIFFARRYVTLFFRFSDSKWRCQRLESGNREIGNKATIGNYLI